MPPLTLPNKVLNRKTRDKTPQPISGLLELPWDIQRIIFENVPKNIWHSMPVGYDGFYYTSKSTEVDLLQVSGEVNAAASYSMQHNQANQPCVLVFDPFQHPDIPLAILETIELAHHFDKIYTERVPKNQTPALAINPLNASLTYQNLVSTITEAVHLYPAAKTDLSEREFNTFITQTLLQLRRKPEIKLRLYVSQFNLWRQMSGTFEFATPQLLRFLALARRLQPQAPGELGYHITIVSENKGIQDQLQATWLGAELRQADWQVATERDVEAWQELDESVNADSGDRRLGRQREIIVSPGKRRRASW